ncbi:MAG: lysostaphin resistance A-like protein [Halobacteriaceae archaeon]
MNAYRQEVGKITLVGTMIFLSIAAFIFGILVLFLLGFFVQGILGLQLSSLDILFLSMISLQGIAFPIAAYSFLEYRNLSFDFIPIELPNSFREIGWIIGGYIGTFVVVYAVAIIVTKILGLPTAQNQAAQIALEHPDILPYIIPLQILVVGPSEELFFRGIIQNTLREKFSAIPAIILASLMFSPAHFTALIGSFTAAIVTIAVLLVPSFLFGVAFERTNNLVVPALMHGLYNATLFGLIYISVVYGPKGLLIL